MKYLMKKKKVIDYDGLTNKGYTNQLKSFRLFFYISSKHEITNLFL